MSKSRIMMGQNGTHANIAVEGSGTFEIAAAFKQAYLQLLGRGAKEFVIDLSACEMLDSTFIGIMIGLGLRMKEQHGTVCLSEANPEIVKVLDDVGLDRLFDYKKP